MLLERRRERLGRRERDLALLPASEAAPRGVARRRTLPHQAVDRQQQAPGREGVREVREDALVRRLRIALARRAPLVAVGERRLVAVVPVRDHDRRGREEALERGDARGSRERRQPVLDAGVVPRLDACPRSRAPPRSTGSSAPPRSS